MESQDIFVRSLLLDKVKLKPNQLSQNVKSHLLQSLKAKFEGVCSYHGFIRPGSLEIYKHSLGNVIAVSLNGDVEFKVQYYADVCNPSIGSIVKSKIVNSNKFGFLAHTGIRNANGVFHPILELIIAKNVKDNSGVQELLDNLSIGDEVMVEVLGKKFELGDKKICAVGRLNQSKKNTKTINELTEDGDTDEEEAEVEITTSDDETESSDESDSDSESEKSGDDKEDDKSNEDKSDDDEDEDIFSDSFSNDADDDPYNSDSGGSDV